MTINYLFMSQKLKKNNSQNVQMFSEAEEYTVIKHDLVRLVLLNLLYLTVVLAVYFYNQKTHFLEAWFKQVFQL